MSERSENLFLVVDNLQSVYDAWSKDDDVRFVTEALQTAVEDAIELFAHGDIPGECRGLAKVVDLLGQQWATFKSTAARAHSPEDQLPTTAFWKTLQLVAEARQKAAPKQQRRLESVRELVDQKVTPAQICDIYEWVDGSGQREIYKVREELVEPGKHTEGYTPPSWRKAELAQERERQTIARIHEQRQRRIKHATEPAPESIEKLIRDGVSMKQIISMKHCSRQDVLDECLRLKLTPPGDSYDALNSQRGVHDPDLNESQERINSARDPKKRPARFAEDASAAAVDPGEEDLDEAQVEGLGDLPLPTVNDDDAADELGDGIPPMTTEQEIIQHSTDNPGMSADDIAVLVSSPTAPVSRQKVSAVLKRYREDPSQFESIG